MYYTQAIQPLKSCVVTNTPSSKAQLTLIHWQFSQHPLALTQPTKWCAGHWWWWTAQPGAGSYWGNSGVRSTSETRKERPEFYHYNKPNTLCSIFLHTISDSVTELCCSIEEHMCWRQRQDGCPPEQGHWTWHKTGDTSLNRKCSDSVTTKL